MLSALSKRIFWVYPLVFVTVGLWTPRCFSTIFVVGMVVHAVFMLNIGRDICSKRFSLFGNELIEFNYPDISILKARAMI